ncbi:GL16084 [Drosophila persimilis]|uniref:GL16084 n=1 Tax=Drosophila persimilis TaxID=7234 RepID=B4H5I4_DROPE|nr:GL16084 [Drosophila persimilis]
MSQKQTQNQLETDQLLFEEKPLHVPPLPELQNVIQGALRGNFAPSWRACVLEKIPHTEPRCALLLNLFLSQGAPGQVLKISAKQRTGEQNFIECIRKGLEDHYGDRVVGLGGIFLIKKGAVHQHVMRDFSSTPIHTDEEVNEWLKFYDMPAQLNAVGTLVTKEHDLDLRLQHFHSFSFSNWGGHYHYDTTPDIVEYEAYLNVAERVVRVDKPLSTHKVGRD